MTSGNKNDIPKKGFAGLRKYWRDDLIAGFSVALVALPLGLGVAIASGAPPLAGIVSAIIGGIFTTFIRSSNVGINGPSAALVVVTLTGIKTLGGGDMAVGFQHVLGTYVAAGGLMAIMGILRMGKLGALIPSSVVHGMMGAIGIIIFASQIHVALGVDPHVESAFDSLKAIPSSLMNMNIPIAVIAVNSVAILALHPYFINKWKLLHFVPAPMLVLLFAVPFVYLFDLFEPSTFTLYGQVHDLGPQYLIDLPGDFFNHFLIRPRFDLIGTAPFWFTVVSVALISTIESLLSTNAVDKLDPFKRETNLNRDLMAVGASTSLSGLLGGLPVITVIVRSTVNVNHGAKTRYSNLFHGVILLMVVALFTKQIQTVPLAALAGILVFTGYRLASPKVFRDIAKKGYEQLFVLVFTILATLTTNLVWGIALGILATLIIQLLKSHLPFKLFFGLLRKPSVRTYTEEDTFVVRIRGLANFTNMLRVTEALEKIPEKKTVIIDFSHARLVDHTILEFVQDWGDKYESEEGEFDIIGLDDHVTTSSHPQSLHVLPPKNIYRLSKRQNQIKEMAAKFGWSFDPGTNWRTGRFRKLTLFESRPIEFTKNYIKGRYEMTDTQWLVFDITFDEGAFLSTEVHHSTMALIELNEPIPEFVLEQEKLLHKLLDIAKKEEIEFEDTQFNAEFSVKGPDPDLIREFFTPEIIDFLRFSDKFHVESNGKSLLIFKSFRYASPQEIKRLIDFSNGWLERMPPVVEGVDQKK